GRLIGLLVFFPSLCRLCLAHWLSISFFLEQADLRLCQVLWRIESQMHPCPARQAAPPRRPLYETLLDEIGLDNIFNRIARFGKGCRYRLNSHRSAAEIFGNHGKVTPIKLIEAKPIHL